MNLKHLKTDRTWTLFLDRDGVINRLKEGDYVKSWAEFEFLPGVLDALKIANSIFGRIVVVTNQQGIGRGLYTHDDLKTIHNNMLSEINNKGGRIDKVYYCPALVSENSPFRKPNTGMALEAQKDFPEIDFKKSIIVGDSISDMELGKRLGMTTVYVSSLNKQTEPTLMDARVNSLSAFFELL